jgi:hypothetical protein
LFDKPFLSPSESQINQKTVSTYCEQGSPMPRQNRVTPLGEIIATPERGLFMGNRGLLHDHNGRIKRSWALKRWIVCVLEFRGRKREVMSPGRYTELFFLDEATAFAAGHRPCAECRRAAYKEYCSCFGASSRKGSASVAEKIDEHLHAERLTNDGHKRTFTALLDDLPDGAFVLTPGMDQEPCLVWGKHLLLWSPAGYGKRFPRPRKVEVEVLTPKSTIKVIRGGYRPEVHESAG